MPADLPWGRRLMGWGYAAMTLGLVPLAAVAAHGRKLPSAWWWLAGAFAVSFVADALALWLTHPIVSQTYPVLQAGLFAFILAPRDVARWTVAGLAAVSGASLWWRGGVGLDVALHVAAFGSTAFLAYRYLTDGWLRVTLTLGFTALVYAWLAFTVWPTFPAWGAVQAVRLLTALGFAAVVRAAAREVRAG